MEGTRISSTHMVFCSLRCQLIEPCLKKVVLFTPGEIAADGYTGYLTNETLTGLFAQEIGGAVILLERALIFSMSREERSLRLP